MHEMWHIYCQYGTHIYNALHDNYLKGVLHAMTGEKSRRTRKHRWAAGQLRRRRMTLRRMTMIIVRSWMIVVRIMIDHGDDYFDGDTCSSFACSIENGEGAELGLPPSPPPWFSFSSFKDSLSLFSSSVVSPRRFWSFWSLPFGLCGTFFSWFNSF